MKCILLLGLCAAASGVQLASHEEPVEKVVNLLTALKEQVTADSKNDKMTYDKTACWCDKATHAKADAIDQAQKDLRTLGQQILKLKGTTATLSSEISQLMSDIKDTQDAMDTATSIRTKEYDDYVSKSTETKSAIGALEQAVKVLQKGTSLLQTDVARSSMNDLISKLPTRVHIKDDQMALLQAFAEGKAHYAPQSQTVQGILTDMYETFAGDLESATSVEAERSQSFEDLMASNGKQIAVFRKNKAAKSEKKAEAETELAEATQTYDDTNDQMNADIKFFDETKQYCKDKFAEFQSRKHLNEEEMDGIAKAVEILSSDEARELFHSAIKPGKEVRTGDYNTGVTTDFLQVSSENAAEQAAMNAFSAIKLAAGQSHSLRLAQLAASVRFAKVGHFDKVLEEIDNMIGVLKDEESADTQKRDQCKDEYHKFDSTSKDLNWQIKKNDAKINKLEGLIAQRTDEKAQTVQDIESLRRDIKSMEDQRKAENQAFLNAKDEDAKALNLLKDARDALTFYMEHNDLDMGPVQGNVKDAFLQKDEPVFKKSIEERPDGSLTDHAGQMGESKAIVSIMTMLIEDLNDEIKNGMKLEETAQADFDKQFKSAKSLEAELLEKKANLEDAITSRNSDMSDEKTTKDENNEELQDEQQYKASIKIDCDFAINTFEERYQKRKAEMHGLVKAKEFLASDFVAQGTHDMNLLQKRSGFMAK